MPYFAVWCTGRWQIIDIFPDKSHERVYSESAGVEQVMLRLYLGRGDIVMVIEDFDVYLDLRVDTQNMYAELFKCGLCGDSSTVWTRLRRAGGLTERPPACCAPALETDTAAGAAAELHSLPAISGTVIN